MVEGGFVDCDRMGNLECQQYSSLSHWLNLVTPKLCEKVVDAGPKGQCEEGVGWLENCIDSYFKFSVIRWQYYYSIFGHLQHRKHFPNSLKMPK